MEDLNVVNGINNASSWLVKNQDLLIQYAVNIVAAIAILIVEIGRASCRERVSSPV